MGPIPGPSPPADTSPPALQISRSPAASPLRPRASPPRRHRAAVAAQRGHADSLPHFLPRRWGRGGAGLAGHEVPLAHPVALLVPRQLPVHRLPQPQHVALQAAHALRLVRVLEPAPRSGPASGCAPHTPVQNTRTHARERAHTHTQKQKNIALTRTSTHTRTPRSIQTQAHTTRTHTSTQAHAQHTYT